MKENGITIGYNRNMPETEHHEVDTQGLEGFVDEVYHEGSDSKTTLHINVPENRHSLPDDKRLGEVLIDVLGSTKFIYVDPNYGNEPYRGGVDIGLSINKIARSAGLSDTPIVVPNISGEAQNRILSEDFPGQEGNIFIVDGLSDIYKKLAIAGNYNDHLGTISTQQEALQDQLREFLANHFNARNLATGEVVEFNGREMAFDINYGSRMLASDATYYTFPVLLSELMEETGKSGLPFDHEKMRQVQRLAQDMEAKYRAKYLPLIHTFSYNDAYDEEGKIFIPPPKHPMTPSQDIDNESIYLMASGTGGQQDTIVKNARELGLDVYKNPFLQIELGTAALPDVIYHPNVTAVLGRAGWGTGWICQQAETPFIVPPYEPPDDPEIYFNIKTFEEKGIAAVYRGQKDIVRQALELTGDISRINENILKKFGTRDGISYMAEKIVQDLHQRKLEEANRR